MKVRNLKQGFTLLEILLVVGIIAILAGIVIVAVNPARQLAQVRNTERKSDIKQIKNALDQYYIDEYTYPTSVTNSLLEICDTGTATSANDCGSLVDLTDLVPTYLVSIPVDPRASTTNGTGYNITKDATGKIVIVAAQAELSQVIAIGTSTVASTTEEEAGTYTVTFNNNGGSGSMSAQSIVEDETEALTANSFTRGGYTFTEWNTLANGSGTSYADEANYTMGSANVTLYAQWEEVAMPSGLIAHWKMNDTNGTTAVDSVGGYTGTGTYTAAAALVGTGALGFNGSDDQIDISSFPAMTGDFIYSVWFKASPASGDARLMRIGQAEISWYSTFYVGMRGSTGKVFIGCYFNAEAESSEGYNDNDWHLATVTYSAGDVVFYVDGSLVTTTSYGFSPSDGAGIGTIDAPTAIPVSIDDVRVYDRALLLSEVQVIYNGGVGTEAE